MVQLEQSGSVPSQESSSCRVGPAGRASLDARVWDMELRRGVIKGLKVGEGTKFEFP